MLAATFSATRFSGASSHNNTGLLSLESDTECSDFNGEATIPLRLTLDRTK